MNMPDINDLPVEILQEVFYNLQCIDLLTSASVSKSWRSSSTTHHFWTNKLKKENLFKLELIGSCDCASTEYQSDGELSNYDSCSNDNSNPPSQEGLRTSSDDVEPEKRTLENSISCFPPKQILFDSGLQRSSEPSKDSCASKQPFTSCRPNNYPVSSDPSSQSSSAEDCLFVAGNCSEASPETSYCDKDEGALSSVCGLRTNYCKWQKSCERWLNGNTCVSEYLTAMENVTVADCDGDTFVVVLRSGLLRIWDINRTFEVIHEFSVEGIVSNVKILGDVLYLSVYKYQIMKTYISKYLLTPRNGNPSLQYSISALSRMHSVWAFSGKQFAVASGTAKKICVFEKEDGRLSQVIMLNRRVSISALLWCSHLLIGVYLYSIYGMFLESWEVESGKSVWCHRLGKPLVYSTNLQWNIEENSVIWAHDDDMYVFDVASGAALAQIKSRATNLVYTVADANNTCPRILQWWKCMSKAKAITRPNRKIRLSDFQFTKQGSIVYRHNGIIHVWNTKSEVYWSTKECDKLKQGLVFWISDNKIVSLSIDFTRIFIIDLLNHSKTNTDQNREEQPITP